MKTLQTKGKARYGPEHSGFTPEPSSKKKRKRVSSKVVPSDDDLDDFRPTNTREGSASTTSVSVAVGRIKDRLPALTNRLFTGQRESAKV